jgi:hypothetical protein
VITNWFTTGRLNLIRYSVKIAMIEARANRWRHCEVSFRPMRLQLPLIPALA